MVGRGGIKQHQQQQQPQQQSRQSHILHIGGNFENCYDVATSRLSSSSSSSSSSRSTFAHHRLHVCWCALCWGDRSASPPSIAEAVPQSSRASDQLGVFPALVGSGQGHSIRPQAADHHIRRAPRRVGEPLVHVIVVCRAFVSPDLCA